MSSAANKRYSAEELIPIVTPVAERYGVGRLYLFGSVARGDYREDSDYDFCIELGNIRSMFVLSGFFQDLRDAVGGEIDLVEIKSVCSELLKAIKEEGVILYEK
jgi:predicted nucleotidyltransferase